MLRQYMDAGKPMYKAEDIDALSQEIVGLDISAIGLEGSGLAVEETSEIQLEPDESGQRPPAGESEPLELTSEGGFGLSQIGDLSMADTNVGTVGINILSGTEDAFKLTEDTKAETQAAADAAEIEELERLDGELKSGKLWQRFRPSGFIAASGRHVVGCGTGRYPADGHRTTSCGRRRRTAGRAVGACRRNGGLADRTGNGRGP